MDDAKIENNRPAWNSKEKWSGISLFCWFVKWLLFRASACSLASISQVQSWAIDGGRLRPIRLTETACHAGSTSEAQRSCLSSRRLWTRRIQLAERANGFTGTKSPWQNVRRLNNVTGDPTPILRIVRTNFGSLCIAFRTYRRETWENGSFILRLGNFQIGLGKHVPSPAVW